MTRQWLEKAGSVYLMEKKSSTKSKCIQVRVKNQLVHAKAVWEFLGIEMSIVKCQYIQNRSLHLSFNDIFQELVQVG